MDQGLAVDLGLAVDEAQRHNQQETQGTLAQHRRFLGINSDCIPMSGRLRLNWALSIPDLQLIPGDGHLAAFCVVT